MRALLEEFYARERAAVQAKQVAHGLLDELFDRQREVVEDPSKSKVILCPRRAGKTQIWVRYATKTALEIPRAIIRIWAISRLRCKQLIWDELRLLCARHQIKTKPNETELVMRFENGSEIRLLGADKDREAQKKRGDKTALEIVLESQMYGAFLKTLVEDVAEPCLLDLNGTLCLEGTPGPLCAGYWFDVSGREDYKPRWKSAGSLDATGNRVGAGWSCHRWAMFDNPHIPHAREWLKEKKAARNWADDNPTYVREYLGRWVNDLQSLFYRFDPIRNTFTLDEIKPWGPGWEHTLGWDLGSRDDMALVVWGYHPDHDTLFEAFSWKRPGALAKEVMAQIEQLEARGFNFVKKVADTGGGGRMYVEEVQSRYEQSFEAAKKTEKYEHVRLFNDDLLTGHVKLQAGSAYSVELAQLQRDLDRAEAHPDETPKELASCPNHCCDAGLYSYRGAWHYLHREAPPKTVKGSVAWQNEREKRLEAQVLESATRQGREWWDAEDLPEGFDE